MIKETMNMVWGSFGRVHIATLILAALMIALLYVVLKNRKRKTQTAVLFVLSFVGNAATVYNLVVWGSPLEYLPLHLCALNGLLLPVAVATRNRKLCNLLLLWSLGAFVALVANGPMANAEITGAPFLFYYFAHVTELGIPLLLFSLDHVEKDPKCIGSTLGLTWGAYTAIYGINKLINYLCVLFSVTRPDGSLIQVNYMYSMGPIDPLSGALWNLLPCEYLYMLLAMPIIAAYLSAVYAPQLVRDRKPRVRCTMPPL